MADGIKARIAGVWKDLTPNIKVAGVWKEPDAVHIRVGGVWKQVWSAGGGGYVSTIAITGTGPVNLRTLANADGYAGETSGTITFTLASGVTITGTAGGAFPNEDGGHAIDTGTWPSPAPTLILQVTGTVRSGGGAGGDANTTLGGDGQNGGDGGDAIHCQEDISITVNSGGVVQAAGGGGGGGGAGLNELKGEPIDTGGGGGGGAFPNGAGGSGGTGLGGQAGAAGTTSGGGAGGNGGVNAGAGGGGGNAATNGSNGINGSQGFGGSGGAAGYAVRKNGNTVPVTNNGTITGTQA